MPGHGLRESGGLGNFVVRQPSVQGAISRVAGDGNKATASGMGSERPARARS